MPRRKHITKFRDGACFVDAFDPKSFFLHRLDPVRPILAEKRTKYQLIQILNTVKFGPALALDGFPQLAENDDTYTEALVVPALLAHPDPKRVLILGGGDGAALNLILKDQRIEEVVLVDIDEQVVILTQQYMPRCWGDAPLDPRGTIVIDDALAFLARETEKFDIIVLDLTDPDEGSASSHLMCPAFFELVASRLKENGVFAMQAGQLTGLVHDGHLSARRLAGTAIPYLYSYAVHVPWFSTVWSFLVGARSPHANRFYHQALVHNLFVARADFTAKLRYLTASTCLALFAIPPAVEKKLSF